MIVTYLIGGYISLFPCKWFESFSFAVIVGILLFGLSNAFILLVDFYGMKHEFNSGGYLLFDSQKILAIGLVVDIFLIFKNLKIRHNRIINKLAASTFGILLIHTNSDTMRRFLWNTVLHAVEFYNRGTALFAVYALRSVISVYLVCFMIDLVRFHFLEVPLFRWLEKKSVI